MKSLAFLLFAALPGPKQFSVNGTLVQRFVDDEAGVVCYFIPKEHCLGDCAYSPAISCVRVSP